MYAALTVIAPSIGARVAHAAAEAESRGAAAGLALLDGIDAGDVAGYQPYWAVRAHVLAQHGRHREAADAYRRAVGLSEDAAIRAFLQRRLDALPAADTR